MENERLRRHICGQTDLVVEIQRGLTAVPALGPENGGQGEWEKAALIETWLAGAHVSFKRFDCPDQRVQSGKRPNIVAEIKGKSAKKLWLFGHMDVVPPGDLSTWKSDPWTLMRDGDIITGRGVEDNQQAIASMLVLADSLAKTRITPELGLGLVFMADEECGSSHGLAWLLNVQPQLFAPGDLYIVPDGGSPTGEAIEIAEKSQLWLKFTVIGRQCHASMPRLGKNAFVGASHLVLSLLELNNIYSRQDALFDPPFSTFVPSKHDLNVPSVNILPGRDVFYMDCRLLPAISADSVLEEINKISAVVAGKHGLHIDCEIVHRQDATRVEADSPIISILGSAIKAVYNVDARPVGIGGATVAAMLREKNLPAVVWCNILNTCHQPNECSSISATCNDAAVFAHIIMTKSQE